MRNDIKDFWNKFKAYASNLIDKHKLELLLIALAALVASMVKCRIHAKIDETTTG